MLRRAFRVAVAGALGRAYAQKSHAWLYLALGLSLLRVVDLRAASLGRRAKRERS
jgi:hypothetical protein